MANNNLNAAKETKKDEFYTQLEDINITGGQTPYHRGTDPVCHKCFDRLIEVAGKLGQGQPVARIDLYIVGDKVYFGEITMTSQGGYQDFYTQEFLDMAGKLTILPVNKNQ